MGTATVHSLRHTFVSLLAQNGASLADIQDALGHASLTMTRRYTHLTKMESAAKLARILDTVTHFQAHSSEAVHESQQTIALQDLDNAEDSLARPGGLEPPTHSLEV
jgi:hypothetical protein